MHLPHLTTTLPLLLLLPLLTTTVSIPVNLTTSAAYNGPSVLEYWQIAGDAPTPDVGATSKLSTTQL